MKQICLIFEFPPEADYQLRSVQEILQKTQTPETVVECLHGFLKKYQPGGLSLLRLLNLFWMYLRVPAHIAFNRPDWIIARSAPPGIQVWSSLWAKLFKVQTIAWIMDYHPEIEARAVEKKGILKIVAHVLRWVDRKALSTMKGTIVLDEAMQYTVRQKAPKLNIQIHPTWDQYGPQTLFPKQGFQTLEDTHTLHFAYAGNLSGQHPLKTIESIFQNIAKQRQGTKIELHVIGTSTKGKERFQSLAELLKLDLHMHPRMSFPDLTQMLLQLQIHYGIVLMEDQAAGLFSPSKFAGYLAAGIPILYCGPEQTNSDKICREFGSGISLRSNAPAIVIEEAAGQILQPEVRQKHQNAVYGAQKYFAGKNASTFVKLVTSMINPSHQ